MSRRRRQWKSRITTGIEVMFSSDRQRSCVTRTTSRPKCANRVCSPAGISFVTEAEDIVQTHTNCSEAVDQVKAIQSAF
eukprot:320387-Rhodomonas_salina.2